MGDEGKTKILLKTYGVLLLYVLLSSGQIFFNKWILSSKEFGFPYPGALTLLHMVFSWALCVLLTKVIPVMKIQPGMTTPLYFQSVVPIGISFGLTLWLGNSAFLYISVSFAQMLKAFNPVAVFVLSVAVGLELLTWRMLGIMTLISGGVLVASYGEVEYNFTGVVYLMGGVLAEAVRLIMIEILLKRKGLKMDPFTMMYYVSPCSALCLLVPFIVMELPLLLQSSGVHIPLLLMVLNALCTFALNLSVFLVIQHTSALTARVAGVVKDWVVVLFSVLIFADTRLTAVNVAGYAVAISGVVLYNQFKLQVPAKFVEENLGESQRLLDIEGTAMTPAPEQDTPLKDISHSQRSVTKNREI